MLWATHTRLEEAVVDLGGLDLALVDPVHEPLDPAVLLDAIDILPH